MNINDYVYVTLTPYGRRVAIEAKCTPAEMQGRFQLWELMSTFGPEMSLCMPEVPFENNEIRFEP